MRLRLRPSLLVSLVVLSTPVLADNDHGKGKHKPDPAMIAARQKIFGLENVDARSGEVRSDKVIFSWITNASFAASVRGRVVLLDTFVTRLEIAPGRTPFTIQDLVDVKPEALFIGHGHFDHADNAAYLSKKTGATIYASPETCDNMQLDAARLAGLIGGASTVPCVSLTSRGSIPGSEVITIRQLEPIATIKAFKHLHSTNTAPQDTSFPPVIIHTPDAGVCAPPCNLADPRDKDMFPTGTSQNSVLDLSTSRAGQGGPISIYYVFQLKGGKDFTFAWHNTTGALREGCALPNNIPGTNPPQPSQPGQDAKGCFGPEVGQKLANLMEFLGPTDVELGSVVSLGFGINGERDIVDYNSHVAPKIFIPNHVTAVAVESSSLEWKVGYRKQQDAMGIAPEDRPELYWLVDPNDYLRPIVFDVDDPRWDKSHRH
ncbi:MAG TPA: MBL fold metallo-hydrolase [Myxococcaceae bacterium]|nr:MBL fold metallo-hydrolase [Myxococcaceae bacterium]